MVKILVIMLIQTQIKIAHQVRMNSRLLRMNDLIRKLNLPYRPVWGSMPAFIIPMRIVLNLIWRQATIR